VTLEELKEKYRKIASSSGHDETLYGTALSEAYELGKQNCELELIE
jgi:hypothetical protein